MNQLTDWASFRRIRILFRSYF